MVYCIAQIPLHYAAEGPNDDELVETTHNELLLFFLAFVEFSW